MEFNKGSNITINMGSTRKPIFEEGIITNISSGIYTVKMENGKTFKFTGTNRFGNTIEPTKKEYIEPSIVKEEKTLYFAYGSNMNLKQMKDRCPTAKLIDKAILKNYQFIINQRGVASIIKKSSSKVYGLIFSLLKNDEESLDLYEGVKNGIYVKDYVTVKGKSSYKTLVYIAENNKFGKPRPGYLEKIIEVSKKLFPSEYIEELESWL